MPSPTMSSAVSWAAPLLASRVVRLDVVALRPRLTRPDCACPFSWRAAQAWWGCRVARGSSSPARPWLRSTRARTPSFDPVLGVDVVEVPWSSQAEHDVSVWRGRRGRRTDSRPGRPDSAGPPSPAPRRRLRAASNRRTSGSRRHGGGRPSSAPSLRGTPAGSAALRQRSWNRGGNARACRAGWSRARRPRAGLSGDHARKVCRHSRLSRATSTVSSSESALTTERPTPCSPPDVACTPCRRTSRRSAAWSGSLPAPRHSCILDADRPGCPGRCP